MDYQIISDGSCDLTMELREKYNIQVVPFYISQDIPAVCPEFRRCISSTCERGTRDHLHDYHQYPQRSI